MENIRLLLIDDEPELLQNLLYDFHKMNVTIDTAKDGREAIDKIKAGSYSCVISDVNMPNMNGITFGKRLKKICKKMPLLFYTAHKTDTLIEKLDFVKPDDILSKPCAPEFMIAKILHAIKKAA